MLEAMVAMVRSQAPVMLPTLPRSLVPALTVLQPSLSGILCSLTGHPALTALYSLYSVDMCGYVLLLLI